MKKAIIASTLAMAMCITPLAAQARPVYVQGGYGYQQPYYSAGPAYYYQPAPPPRAYAYDDGGGYGGGYNDYPSSYPRGGQATARGDYFDNGENPVAAVITAPFVLAAAIIGGVAAIAIHDHHRGGGYRGGYGHHWR